MTQVISAREAAALVHDGNTLAHSGFVGFGLPDYLLGNNEVYPYHR